MRFQNEVPSARVVLEEADRAHLLGVLGGGRGQTGAEFSGSEAVLRRIWFICPRTPDSSDVSASCCAGTAGRRRNGTAQRREHDRDGESLHRPADYLAAAPEVQLGTYGGCRASAAVPRRVASWSRTITWSVPATGIAASAPRTPASSAPMSTEMRTTSGESCTVRP